MAGGVVTARTGPWQRVLDTARAGKPDPQALRDLANGLLTPDGSALLRPGFRRLPKPATGAAQFGPATVTVAGVDYTYAVVGGALYQLNWTTETWATVAPSGVTIAASGLVSLVAYAGRVVVSDGANRPWSFDPASPATGTPLPATDGAAYGPLRTHYAKLFWIDVDSRNTGLWTEEQDFVGGDQGGYNNAWDLKQTSDDPLTALIAEEGRLVYFRPASAGAILGAVDADFQSNGTFDAVSPTRGTRSPYAVCLTDTGTVWFLDSEGRPCRVRAGQGVDDIGLACAATTATVRRDRLEAAWAVYHPDADVVLFAVPRTAASTANTDLLVFDRASGEYRGRWTVAHGVTFATGGIVRDEDGVRRFAFLDPDGDAHVQASVAALATDATAALDQFAADYAADTPAFRVVLPEFTAPGADQAARVQWQTLILETGDPWAGTVPPVQDAASTGTTLAYACETPTRAYDATATTVTVGAAGRKAVGLSKARLGRWLRVALTAPAGAGDQVPHLRRVTAVGTVRDTLARAR